MTAEEWITSDDPLAMLAALRGWATGRQFQLYACACFRRNPAILALSPLARAVAAAERWADGIGTRDDVWAAAEPDAGRDEACGAYWGWLQEALTQPRPSGSAWVAAVTLMGAVDTSAYGVRLWNESPAYLRCIVGNPFPPAERRRPGWLSAVASGLVRVLAGSPLREEVEPSEYRPPVDVEPEWLTSTVVALARGVYDEHAFDRLPILADALMDAGCNHPDVLAHCRDPGPHVRGCWVVDLVLGKS